MIGHLKDAFPKVPILVLSATVIPNVLEYVCKLLQLWTSTWLYKKLFDQLNITYIVAQIKKPGFKEFNFFVTLTTLALAIPKTIIFVDNIDTASKLTIYLQSRVSTRLCKKASMFIQIFSINLTVET